MESLFRSVLFLMLLVVDLSPFVLDLFDLILDEFVHLRIRSNCNFVNPLVTLRRDFALFCRNLRLINLTALVLAAFLHYK